MEESSKPPQMRPASLEIAAELSLERVKGKRNINYYQNR